MTLCRFLSLKKSNLWQNSSTLIGGLSLPLSFASKNIEVHFSDVLPLGRIFPFSSFYTNDSLSHRLLSINNKVKL